MNKIVGTKTIEILKLLRENKELNINELGKHKRTIIRQIVLLEDLCFDIRRVKRDTYSLFEEDFEMPKDIPESLKNKLEKHKPLNPSKTQKTYICNNNRIWIETKEKYQIRNRYIKDKNMLIYMKMLKETWRSKITAETGIKASTTRQIITRIEILHSIKKRYDGGMTKIIKIDKGFTEAEDKILKKHDLHRIIYRF